jgi:hypothetical protein
MADDALITTTETMRLTAPSGATSLATDGHAFPVIDGYCDVPPEYLDVAESHGFRHYGNEPEPAPAKTL